MEKTIIPPYQLICNIAGERQKCPRRRYPVRHVNEASRIGSARDECIMIHEAHQLLVKVATGQWSVKHAVARREEGVGRGEECSGEESMKGFKCFPPFYG